MMTVSGVMYPDTCPSESVDLVGDGNVVLEARVALVIREKPRVIGSWHWTYKKKNGSWHWKGLFLLGSKTRRAVVIPDRSNNYIWRLGVICELLQVQFVQLSKGRDRLALVTRSDLSSAAGTREEPLCCLLLIIHCTRERLIL
ncbi:hypothetical protein CIPAW_06G001300 [Carya illinoinensis]|uniref:Uncharacterized protein n=1 Tax=Carya illinoinensis TaxID=32201 RepID=A0A8T1Q5Z1_CARIL|nr:hypothetical protein CIPAW_06G001300 [Carya illinoinensis]